jgi:AraC-like DNA-binding protein
MDDAAEVAEDTAVVRQWRPERSNRVAYDGFVAMVGGPDGRYLPEHAHAELQITVRFGPRRTVQLVEPHESHRGGWADGERVAVMLLAPELLAEALDDIARRSACTIRSGFHPGDALTRELGRAVAIELAGPEDAPNRRLFFEAIGHTLAGHVVRKYGAVPVRAPVRDGLTDRQLACVRELVDASFDRDLGVAAMAASVGLAPRRFADRFRRATGVTPYRYVLGHRIAAAKRLLPRAPIAEVALRVGFSSQSHFTSTFLRIVGVTPARWRDR